MATTPRSATNYGGLILRGSTWHMRFTVKGETVAESTYTGVRRDAERLLAKRKAALIEEMVLAGKKPIKLHDAIDFFVKSRSHMKSAQSCEIHIRYFKDAPNHHLDRVTNEELEAVLAAKRADGYAESTLKVSVSYFNAMIKYCDEMGYTVRKKMKPIKHNSSRIRWLSKDELQKLYAALDPMIASDDVTQAQKQENLDLAKLLYETGTRYGEMAALAWNDINFVAGTVYVRRLKGSVSNTIRMTKTMREILVRRRKFEQGDVVFSTKQRDYAEGAWMRGAVKRANLSTAQGKVTLHTLRHTKAVHLLQGGMSILELKTWMGHRDINSTLVYAHVVESDVMNKALEISDLVTQE